MGVCCGKNPPEDMNIPPPADPSPEELRAKQLVVDELVIDMLVTISSASFINNDQSPGSLTEIHAIADKEDGWIQVVTSISNVIPLDDPFGPSAITLLLDDCPLPSKETVIKASELFGLSAERASLRYLNLRVERNICIVLGCIAEKLAGPNSVAILTPKILDYLVTFLVVRREPKIVLFALIALEKFAHTTDNKLTIKERFLKEKEHPLLVLENLHESDDVIWRQVGFCAKWALDNLFVVDGRKLSYEVEDMSKINAILNTKDVSEYLKISPNGLEARCDSYSFESVRCTFQVDGGCWYYEAIVITPGVMQIGYATRTSHFMTHEGFGIGDDCYSLSYDGCRRLIWHDARPIPFIQVSPWLPGDVLGCLIDIERKEVIFSLNGYQLPARKKIFEVTRSGFFAAASFMSFQQCLFNFGSEPFHYPPKDRPFSFFNKYGKLTDEEKKVVPRRIILEKLRNTSVREDCCTLCCDEVANCILHPCGHRGYCSVCVSQLRECPMCRADILDVRFDVTS